MRVAVIDYETSYQHPHPSDPESYPVMLGYYEPPGVELVWWLHDSFQHECIKTIQRQLEEVDLVIAHNAKFEYEWSTVLGLDLEGHKIWCTQIAEYLLNGQFGNVKGGKRKGLLKLNTVAQRRGFGKKLDRVAEYWKAGYETDEIPTKLLAEYCLQDCKLTYQIFKQQLKEAQEKGMIELLRLQFELIRSASDIELAGFCVNPELFERYSKEYQEKIAKVEAELMGIINEPSITNLGSNDQLSAALYGGTITVDGTEEVERTLKSGEVKRYTRKCKKEVQIKGLGFTPPEDSECKKKGFYSTDKNTLAKLTPMNATQKKVLELLGELSEYTKQDSTYFGGMVKHVRFNDRDQRNYIYPQINQTVTGTGRLSSSKPNGQNIPRGSTSPAKQPFITRYQNG